MTDEGEGDEGARARTGTILRHLLCALVALVSFAVSTPLPLRLHHRHAEDLRRASIVQLDDDEERELLLALLEEEDADDEPDEPPLPDLA